jgi:hypothetical protein
MNSGESCPPAFGVTFLAAVSRRSRHLFRGKTRSWRHLFLEVWNWLKFRFNDKLFVKTTNGILLLNYAKDIETK